MTSSAFGDGRARALAPLAARRASASTMRPRPLHGVLGIRSWRPDGAARAVAVIVHGFNSHSGPYVWVADQLASSGLAVYALDLRCSC